MGKSKNRTDYAKLVAKHQKQQKEAALAQQRNERIRGEHGGLATPKREPSSSPSNIIAGSLSPLLRSRESDPEKKTTNYKCSSCGKPGHNTLKCPHPDVGYILRTNLVATKQIVNGSLEFVEKLGQFAASTYMLHAEDVLLHDDNELPSVANSDLFRPVFGLFHDRHRGDQTDSTALVQQCIARRMPRLAFDSNDYLRELLEYVQYHWDKKTAPEVAIQAFDNIYDAIVMGRERNLNVIAQKENPFKVVNTMEEGVTVSWGTQTTSTNNDEHSIADSEDLESYVPSPFFRGTHTTSTKNNEASIADPENLESYAPLGYTSSPNGTSGMSVCGGTRIDTVRLLDI